MLKKYCFFIYVILYTSLYASDNQLNRQLYDLIIVPGQNELGGRYGEIILRPYVTTVYHSRTPLTWIDLGQKNCINHFKNTIEPLQNDNNKNLVLHASSQGSATVLNYVSQKPDKVSMIIIESMLASGNSAVQWTIKNAIPSIENVPGSYYLLPYLAKIFAFWTYQPAGIQAIHSIDKIPNTIPIILIHCKNDPQLAYSDAEAIYARLQKNGNTNVYLIPIESKSQNHIELVRPQSPIHKVIDAILIKHGISKNKNHEEINLTPYQPIPNNDAYTKLITHENRLRYIINTLKYSTYVGITACMGYLLMTQTNKGV